VSETYEEVLSYSIYRAIELRAKELQRKLGFDDLYTNSLVDIPHNSLLTDKDWVYENVEYLFVYCMFNYQKFQGSEEYYLLFKTLIEKYNIEEDYNELLCDCKCFGMELKWGRFAHLLVEFFAHAFDQHDVLDELFCKSDFVNYFCNAFRTFTLLFVARHFGNRFSGGAVFSLAHPCGGKTRFGVAGENAAYFYFIGSDLVCQRA